MNPPFDDLESAPPSPVAKRRHAHIAAPGLLDAWIATAAKLLKPAGTIGLIHRAGELPRIVNALGARFGDIRILPVHASAGDAAIRILVQARRDSRASLSLLPDLVLHQADGAWTARADAILRGHAELLL
jgi:tRNA1(Val) A37 N6-methylase TrmN6